MPLKLRLSITADAIQLEIPERAIALHFSNRIAYDPQRITLLSYGKIESEVKKEMGSDWLAFQQRSAWARIFDPKATGPILDYQVLDLMLLKARRQLGAKRMGWVASLFPDPLDIQAEIQDYELLSLGRRRELEYYLQDYQRAQSLRINGEDRTIPPRWRTAQNWVGLFARILIPVGILFGGFQTIFTRQGQEAGQFLAMALGWVAVALLCYFLGTVLWLLIFRKHLPQGYLRYQLRSSGSLLRRPTRWLADKLL